METNIVVVGGGGGSEVDFLPANELESFLQVDSTWSK